jgi:hypothetical protein
VGLRLRRAPTFAVAAALCIGAQSARAAPPQACSTPRPFDDDEVSFVGDEKKALRALLPDPPPGWVRQAVTETATPGPLCDDPGYKPPLFVRLQATYLPVDAPELTLEKRAAESAAYRARLDAAAREEAAAVASGDRGRIERARRASRELMAHPVPTPPASPPRSPRRLEVRLQVNPTSYQSCARSAPIDVAGAAAAFRATSTTCRDRAAGDVWLAAFGAWKPKPTTSGAFLAAFNQWPAPPVLRTKAHTALVEIAGDPDAVEAVVGAFDPSRVRALVDSSSL